MTTAITRGGLTIKAPISDAYQQILTEPACQFVSELVQLFRPRLKALLAARAERQAQFDAGTLPDFLPETQAIRDGAWQRASQFCLLDFPIVELEGKTLGLLGHGELGSAVAKLAEALGMRVLVGNLPGRPKRPDRLDLDELLPQVDALTLHCPLTEQTRNLIGARELQLMKPSAFLINAARGGLVDEQALADALRRGHLGGAATDVLTSEPPRDDNPLLAPDLPRLIVTPHSAWGSREARQRIVAQLAENATAFFAGSPLRQVN
mgnify:CR=1 FL=1